MAQLTVTKREPLTIAKREPLTVAKKEAAETPAKKPLTLGSVLRKPIEPIGPLRRFGRSVAASIRGEERPDEMEGKTPLIEMAKQVGGQIKENPITGTANALVSILGLDKLRELNPENIRAGNRGPGIRESTAEAVEGLSSISPVELLLLRAGGKKVVEASGGKPKAKLSPVAKNVLAGKKPEPTVPYEPKSDLSPVLPKGKSGAKNVKVKTEGYADPYIREAEAQYTAAKAAALESTKGVVPEGNPLEEVLAELKKPDVAPKRSDLPPSELPPEPSLLGVENPQHPLSQLEGQESVTPGRAIPEPAGMVKFAEESGAAAQRALVRSQQRQRARQREIEAEIERQMLAHQAEATKRGRALKQGAREPKIDLPLEEGGPIPGTGTPRVASVAELDQFVAAKRAEAQAAPGTASASLPLKAGAPPVATTAEVAMKRRNLLQKVKKLETGNSGLDKKVTRFNYLVGQQKEGLLSAERAAEMAKLEREILQHPALPKKLKASWERMNEEAAGRPSEPASGKPIAVAPANRPVGQYDARGIRIPTSQQRAAATVVPEAQPVKPKEVAPEVEAAAAAAKAEAEAAAQAELRKGAFKPITAEDIAARAEAARNAAAQTAKEKGRFAPGAAVDLSEAPTTARADEPISVRSQEMVDKIVPPPPEPVPITPEEIASVRELALTSIRNQTPFIQRGPLNPRTIQTMQASLPDPITQALTQALTLADAPEGLATTRSGQRASMGDILATREGTRPPVQPTIKIPDFARGAVEFPKRLGMSRAPGIEKDRRNLTAMQSRFRKKAGPTADVPTAGNAGSVSTAAAATGSPKPATGKTKTYREQQAEAKKATREAEYADWEKKKIAESPELQQYIGEEKSRAQEKAAEPTPAPTPSPLPPEEVKVLHELNAAQAQDLAKGAPKWADPDTWEAMQSIEATLRQVYEAEGTWDPRLVNDMRRFWGSREAANRLGISKGLVEQLSGEPHRQRPLKALIEESDARYRFMIENPDGFAKVETLAAMTGGAMGALAGGTLDGEDPIDTVSYMLAGALIGGKLGSAGVRALQGTKFGSPKAAAEALDTANMLAGPAAIKASLGSLGAVFAASLEARAMGNVAGAKRGLHFMRTEAPGMWWKILTGPSANLNRSSTFMQNAVTTAGLGSMPQKFLVNVMRPFIAADTVATAAMRRMGFSPAEIDRLMLQGTPTSHVGQQGLRLAQKNFAFRIFAKFPRTRIGSLERGVEYTPGLNKWKSTRNQSPDMGFKPQETLSAAQLKARGKFGAAMMVAGSAYGYWADPGPIMGGLMAAAAGPATIPAAIAMAAGKALRHGQSPLAEAAASIVSTVPQVGEADVRGFLPSKDSWIPRRLRPGGALQRAIEAMTGNSQ